jgi:hypothetical protein
VPLTNVLKDESISLAGAGATDELGVAAITAGFQQECRSLTSTSNGTVARVPVAI